MSLKIKTEIINYEPETDGLLFSFAAMSNERDEGLLGVMGRLGMIWGFKISENFESKKAELNKNFSAEFNEFITSSYYDPTKLEDFEINKNFEELLERINQWLKIKRVNNIRLEEFIETLNVTVFVFLNQEINFSQIGFNRHFLIRPSEEAVELSQTNKKKIVPFSQNKFSNVINGDLEQDNLLVFFTEEFIKYYDYNKLPYLLAEGAPFKKIISEIKKSLIEKKYNDPFSLMLLNLSEGAEENEIAREANQEKELKTTEDEENIKQTENAVPEIDESKIDEKEDNEKESKIDEHNILNNLTEEESKKDALSKPLAASEEIKDSIKKVPDLGKSILCQPGRGIKLLTRFFGKILFFQYALDKFKKLTWQQKLAVIFSFILGLAFIGGLFYNIKLNYHTNNSREYSDLINSIRNKEKEIQQTIALKDEVKIGSLYVEFRELTKSLPNMTESQKNEYNAIQQRVDSQFKSALKENKPSQVKILADFQSVQADLLNELIHTTKKLYVLDRNTQTIYAIDVLDGQKTAVYKAPENSSKIIKLRLADQDNLLILYDNQKLSNINLLDNKLTNFSLETKNKNLKISDLFIYSQKLYILDNTSGKIFKYTKTLNGFSREEEWLKVTHPDLIGALSFTSDGSIYALTADNKIKKFHTGQEQIFNFKITPPLDGQGNKILTFYGNNYVYILNPEYERIILVNKDGKVIKIIGDSEIKNALDLQVNEKNKKIWVNTKDKILEYEI